MHDIATMDKDALPTTQSLIKATLIALVSAAVIVVTAILPAEYGVDPTGLGKVMGLHVLSQAQADEPSQPATTNLLAASTDPVWKSLSGPRSDTLTLTLQPGQGAELKAKMQVGDNFVFGWKAKGGAVFFDMHGERPNDGNNFTSYWIGKDLSESNGSFTAPFDGTHGWYWENTSQQPITITLNTSGFYAAFYQP